MKLIGLTVKRVLDGSSGILGAPFWLIASFLVSASANGAGFSAELLERENEVVAQKAGGRWQPAVIGFKMVLRDKVSTGAKSRAVLAVSDRSVIRLDENTIAEIGTSSVTLSHGGLYFFSRERGAEIEIKGPAADGFMHGTQVVARVSASGKTVFSVLEGELEMVNKFGRITLRSREQGEAEIGRPPHKTAVIAATNLLQWALYYPAVLEPKELGMSAADEVAVAASLSAYREGDLLGALEKYPKNYHPQSAAARLYRAGVILAVGQVAEARKELAAIKTDHPARRALEDMIAAVNFTERRISKDPSTASEWLAHSYYIQSRDDSPERLKNAIEAARRATALAPGFGFASVRVAELEFSLGQIQPALCELDRIPRLSSRNAQAHALRGFILSAQNRIDAARAEFQTAIDLDGALGNAWLGRGLCAIRQGRDADGRLDLQVAATMEPNRSILHSYLGKAFSQIGDNIAANKDLARAQELDPNDPTPLLYSAIQRKQENRYNEAIGDLESSIELNDKRRVYRSEFLLDQDLAIRNANLASIYRNNEMIEQSVREAVRAVNNDYASAPAHLFLSNSYNALRDSTRILLRYEAAWSNELLLANMLSPVGGGPLSQFVSEQEYSKLFERDGLGFNSVFEYRGDGQLRETASQFGTSGNLGYALDAEYQFNRGVRPNNRLSRFEGYGTFKLQLGPQDSLFLQTKFGDLSTGDLFQRYDPGETSAVTFDVTDADGVTKKVTVPNRPALTFHQRETQEPSRLLLGWHHEWSPGNHTLLLLGRLANHHEESAKETGQTIRFRDIGLLAPAAWNGTVGDTIPRDAAFFAKASKFAGQGDIFRLSDRSFDLDYESDFKIYTAELQQIFTLGANSLVLGGRYQNGEFDTKVGLSNYENGRKPGELKFFQDPPVDQNVGVDFERINLYAYDTWRATPWLLLTGGVTFNRMLYPQNFTSPPVNDKQASLDTVLPKAGIVLEPWRGAAIRAGYSRANSGASFDENIRLEPTQVAGFLQTYRSLASESLIGSVTGAKLDLTSLSFEQKLPSRTYLGVELNRFEEKLDRTLGTFDLLTFSGAPLVAVPSSYIETLRYRENAITATINQLVGENWAFSTRYRYTDSILQREDPELSRTLAVLQQPLSVDAVARNSQHRMHASLHELNLYALYNHPCGFFARVEANWYQQDSDDYILGAKLSDPNSSGLAHLILSKRNAGQRGDDFWQFNVLAGYRFYRNQCEISCGVLNLTDRDYRLNPLNPYEELPRERTLVVRCKVGF